MTNDREYILQCRTCLYLLNKPRRDSSFMKLGSSWPISLSFLPRCSAFHMETFPTCKRCMGCMSAKSPGIGTHANIHNNKNAIDAGQQHNTEQTNRCDPLRLGSKNQSYQFFGKTGGLPKTLRTSWRKLNSHHFSHWQKTTCNNHQLWFCKAACNAETSSQTTTKTTDHQLSQLIMKVWSPCFMCWLGQLLYIHVHTACTYSNFKKNYESHKIWARWGQPLDTSFDWIVCNALSGFMSPTHACTTMCRPTVSVLTPALLTP